MYVCLYVLINCLSVILTCGPLTKKLTILEGNLTPSVRSSGFLCCVSMCGYQISKGRQVHDDDDLLQEL